MEQTKERSRWAGRLEVVLVMATVWLFGFSTSFIRFGYWTGQILRFCLLAVLPCVVLLPHPFAYMGFTRKRIGKQLLFGLLTALILYPVCMAISLLIRQPVVPEGYRISFSLRLLNQSGSLIASQAVSILILSVPEELLFRGYFQNRLVFFTSSRYARWMIQAVLFGLFHIVNHLDNPLSPDTLVQVTIATVYGLIVGWLYMNREKTGYTILSAMTSHVLYNGMVQFLLFDAVPA